MSSLSLHDKFISQVLIVCKNISDGRSDGEIIEQYDREMDFECSDKDVFFSDVGCTVGAPMSEKKISLPPFTNRGLVKYHGSGIYPDTWGGYDGGVELGVYGIWRFGFADLIKQLEKAKTLAADGDELSQYVDLAGYVVKVSMTGARCGGCVYKYVVEFCGLKVYFHSNARGNIAPVRVRFGFASLINKNLFEVYDSFCFWLHCLGFRKEREIISRVDMQVLTPHDIEDIFFSMRGDRVVTLCRGKMETHFNLKTARLETISIKSKTMELCVYDKLAQLSSVDPVYFSLFQNYVLSEVASENLTRVEFRFRRDFLKRYGITTIDDLRKSQLALIEIACLEWFRILENPKVRGSEREQKIHPLWEDICNRFFYYFGKETDTKNRKQIKSYRSPRSVSRVERLITMALGTLSSAASLELSEIESTEQVLNYVFKILEQNKLRLTQRAQLRQIDREVTQSYIPNGEISVKKSVDIFERLYCV
ncbi:MAG: hypothetical protein Q4C96_11005 [Planctomycetia bacterium]|nr:hypothetical protein [Planctomycetia bacterium]